MLSYRHAFHAGNFADVMKHSLLVLLIQAMQRKDTPFVYIDTHAGAGLYCFDNFFARKTEEFVAGIGQFWGKNRDRHPHFEDYITFLEDMNPDQQLLNYPGSPWFAQYFLRAKDRLQLSELHSADFDLLSGHFTKIGRSTLAREDSFASLTGKLPPPEKRGLIFIDPSYEVKEDYRTAIQVLVAAQKKFATGVYCLWYPILRRDANERFIGKLAATGIRRILQIKLIIAPSKRKSGLVCSGLFIINPPYKIDQQASSLLPCHRAARCPRGLPLDWRFLLRGTNLLDIAGDRSGGLCRFDGAFGHVGANAHQGVSGTQYCIHRTPALRGITYCICQNSSGGRSMSKTGRRPHGIRIRSFLHPSTRRHVNPSRLHRRLHNARKRAKRNVFAGVTRGAWWPHGP